MFATTVNILDKEDLSNILVIRQIFLVFEFISFCTYCIVIAHYHSHTCLIQIEISFPYTQIYYKKIGYKRSNFGHPSVPVENGQSRVCECVYRSVVRWGGNSLR